MKDPVKTTKRQNRDREKISSDHTTDKGLIPRNIKNAQPWTVKKKNQTIHLENWQKS